LPARGPRLGEEPLAELDALVDAIADALVREIDKPYALLGHSMGAMLSFELARAFRRRGRPAPSRLFVCGHRAPHIPPSSASIHDYPEAKFVEELRHLNGTPAAVLDDPALLELLMPCLRADFRICGTYSYSPEPPLACPITAIGGADDASIDPGAIEAW